MAKHTIAELLNVFNYYTLHGKAHALRVFNEHREFILENEHKTFRQVEAELLTKKGTFINRSKRKGKRGANRVNGVAHAAEKVQALN
jgi:hypothetical protein